MSLSSPAWRRRGIALAAGVVAALAHPPFGFVPGLLAYGLILHRLDRCASLRGAFATGWLSGLGYFAVSTWWVAEAFLVDAESQGWMAPIAVTLLAGGLGLFWGGAALVYRWIAPAGPLRALVFAGILTGFEWLRGHVLTGFPWNLPGESWAAGSAASQAASVFGAYGLTWITLAIACSLTVVLEGRQGRNLARSAAAGLLLLHIGGAVRLALPPAPDADPVVVRIVQADVAQAAKYDQAMFTDIVTRYLRLTRQAGANGAPPRVVIWPEGAIPAAIDEYLAPGTWTLAAITQALAPGQTLLVGAYRVDMSGADPVYFNSLVAARRTADGLTIDGVYDKHRLVPGGEYLPFDALLGALGVKKLVHVGDGFTGGPPPRPMTLPGLPTVQPLICYESLFPGFVRDGARAAGRPRWIVNVSNDAWFGATSGPRQHLNLAAYRAIEEGLPMVRATPTGVSAVISSRGEVLERLEMGQAGVLDTVLPSASAPTLYGWFAEPALVILLMISAASTGWVSMLKRLVKLRKS